MTDTGGGAGRPPLSALLSQVLGAFVIEFDIEFERQMPHRTTDHGRTQGQGKVPWLVLMAMWSTCMRFITTEGITSASWPGAPAPGRTLPGCSGVSKEGISMALGILAKHGLAVSGPATDGGRGQVATLTPRGRSVQNKCRERITGTENRWQARFGREEVTALREALERLTSDPGSRLSEGLEPPPGGWRAGGRGRATLPQYPMVLHRGGFPDGS